MNVCNAVKQCTCTATWKPHRFRFRRSVNISLFVRSKYEHVIYKQCEMSPASGYICVVYSLNILHKFILQIP